MKRLLLPLLAALALPTAVNAKSYWLIIGAYTGGGGVGLEKLEMNSMEQCKEQGEIFRTTGNDLNIYIAYKCLKGK